MNRPGLTTQERIALEKIKGIPTRSLYMVFAIGGMILSLQALPERYSAVSAIVSVGLALGMVATLAYQACFLRCPRCSGWIVVPKCPGCGLKLDEPAGVVTSRGSRAAPNKRL
jgi:hypothetical protein